MHNTNDRKLTMNKTKIKLWITRIVLVLMVGGIGYTAVIAAQISLDSPATLPSDI